MESTFRMDGLQVPFKMMVRPFAEELLAWAEKQFYVDVFTAARSEYAEEALRLAGLLP